MTIIHVIPKLSPDGCWTSKGIEFITKGVQSSRLISEHVYNQAQLSLDSLILTLGSIYKNCMK